MNGQQRGSGMAARYYSNCVKCGRESRIKYMASIYIRPPAYGGAAKILCHICPDCLPEFLDELEVAMPE